MKSDPCRNHTIYGRWTDTGGNQFMVFEDDATFVVFICGGQDYGGGIEYACLFNIDDEKIRNRLNEICLMDEDYERYTAMNKFCKTDGIRVFTNPYI